MNVTSSLQKNPVVNGYDKSTLSYKKELPNRRVVVVYHYENKAWLNFSNVNLLISYNTCIPIPHVLLMKTSGGPRPLYMYVI